MLMCSNCSPEAKLKHVFYTLGISFDLVKIYIKEKKFLSGQFFDQGLKFWNFGKSQKFLYEVANTGTLVLIDQLPDIESVFSQFSALVLLSIRP